MAGESRLCRIALRGEIMSLVTRVKNLILSPKAEWEAIAAEPFAMGAILRGHVLPLAGLSVLAAFIGTSLVGYTVPGLPTFRIPIGAGLIAAVAQLILTVPMIWLLAQAIRAMAPHFGGRDDFPAAFKVAAYAYTPAWVAGLFQAVPALAILSILGLYGIYVLHVGLPRLMGSRTEKGLVYTACVVAIGIVLGVLVGMAAALFIPPSARSF